MNPGIIAATPAAARARTLRKIVYWKAVGFGTRIAKVSRTIRKTMPNKNARRC
jgi:hypothetical protein